MVVTLNLGVKSDRVAYNVLGLKAEMFVHTSI